MSLGIASPELHFLRGICRSADYEKLNLGRTRRRRVSVSVVVRPISCFASPSSSSPAKEVALAAGSSSLEIRRPERPSPSNSSSSSSSSSSSASSSCDFVGFKPPSSASPSCDFADFKPPSSDSPSCDLADLKGPFSAASSCDLAEFKPPPPAAPTAPKDLVADLPFHYWYSYADLPPGVPKRKPRNPLPSTSESGEKKDGLNERRTGGSGGLWEAVLAVEGKSKLDVPKVVRRERRRGGGGDLRESENGIFSTDNERRFSGATSGALQEEDENAPLTEEDKKRMIRSCHGTGRQINIGWEGWNENYIALIHTYWKRSRVCKIKCKGAMTLDMDTLCNILEVETGGTVIGRVGGTVYLFRGWSYDYWRNPGRLIIRFDRAPIQFPKKLPVPSKLTKGDINALRARGRVLPALCKPGKHGVYLTLLDDIRKAFETQDLVRVNCQDFYARNMKILGSRLQELVPCELISFEFEHILMWRSMDGRSPKGEKVLEQPEDNSSPVSNALS